MMSVPLKPHLVSEVGEVLFDRYLKKRQRQKLALVTFAAAGKRPLIAFAQAAWKFIKGRCSRKQLTSTLTSPVSALLSCRFLRALTTDVTLLQLDPQYQRALFANKWITDLTLYGRFRSIGEVYRIIRHWPDLERFSCDLSVFMRLVNESDIELPYLRYLELDGHRKPFNFRLSRCPRIPFPEMLVLRCSYKLKSYLEELFSPITQFPGVKHLELHVHQQGMFTAADFLAIDALIAMFPNLEGIAISITIREAILKDFSEVIPLLNVLTTNGPHRNISFAFRIVGRACPISQNYIEIFETRGFSIVNPGVNLVAECTKSQNFVLNMMFLFL